VPVLGVPMWRRVLLTARSRRWRPHRSVTTAIARARALAFGVLTIVGGVVVRWTPARSHPTAADYPKVFVVGCPRSGTTWVADILGRHPAVIRGQESQLYSTIRHSLGTYGAYNPIGWARLFYGVERGVRIGANAGMHFYVDAHTLLRVGWAVLGSAPRRDQVTPKLVRAVLDSYFVQQGGTAGRVLVEKTPTHVFYLDDILTGFPDAHVVEVVRDGRDVCVSMALRSERVSAFPTTNEGRIRLWVHAVEAGRVATNDARWHGRIVKVRYEDLKASPVEQIARMFAAVDLPASDDLVREIAEASDIARFATGPGEFRHRGEVGTWVDHLSAEDEAAFRSLAGATFTAAGYSFDSPGDSASHSP